MPEVRFWWGPAGPSLFFSGSPEAQSLSRVLILANITRTWTCVLLWLLHVVVVVVLGGVTLRNLDSQISRNDFARLLGLVRTQNAQASRTNREHWQPSRHKECSCLVRRIGFSKL